MKCLIKHLISGSLGFALLIGALVFTSAASAEEQSKSFYEGKTVTVVIRSAAGGGYDFYGRLIARHIGKYLPGEPNVIAVNRPGAGGMVATNYMYSRAPKDGTEIFIAARELGVPERLEAPGVRYKTLEMPPIGSVSQVARVWLAGPDVPVSNLEDLAGFRDKTGRDFRFAVSGKGAGSYQLAMMLKEAGYPVKVITGYEGTSEQNLAILRGEADGNIDVYTNATDAIEDEEFKVITKLGDHPDLANVKSFRQAVDGKGQQVAEVLDGLLRLGRPFFTAPGVPPEQLASLREAFRKVVEDPAAQDEAQRAGRPWGGYTGPEEMTAIYRNFFEVPIEVVEMLGE